MNTAPKIILILWCCTVAHAFALDVRDLKPLPSKWAVSKS
jgi:hypothetical protein